MRLSRGTPGAAMLCMLCVSGPQVLRDNTHAHSWPRRAGLPQDARQNMSWHACRHAHLENAPKQVAPQRRVRTVLGRASAATICGRPAAPPGHPRLGVDRVPPTAGGIIILHDLLIPRSRSSKTLHRHNKSVSALRRQPCRRRTRLPRNIRRATSVRRARASIRVPNPLMRGRHRERPLRRNRWGRGAHVNRAARSSARVFSSYSGPGFAELNVKRRIGLAK